MNNQLKSYFYYSKNEKRGLLFLLVILMCLLAYWSYLAKSSGQIEVSVDGSINIILCDIENKKAVEIDNKKYRAKLRQEEYDNKYKNKWPKKNYKKSSKKKTTVTPLVINTKFNPNQVTKSILKDMGLAPKTVSTWLNFIQKGGSFKSPKDLSKLYNLSSTDYEQLYPFVDIPIKEKNKYPDKYVATKPAPKKDYNDEKKGIISLIDLNTATLEELLPIYSVGPTTARRIIEYREELGGFNDIGQVAKIWWMPDSTFQQIAQNVIIVGTTTKTITINTADLETLKAHPLIDYKLAKSIYNYRKQHGRYQDWKDVKKLHLIKGHEHIEPYIRY